MANCSGCKNFIAGSQSCYLRRQRFCGEDAKHLAKRLRVEVINVSADPSVFHLEWPVTYKAEDVIVCPYYREGTPKAW